MLLTDAGALEPRADWVLEPADRMLWGNRVVPESGRMLPVPFLMSYTGQKEEIYERKL